MKKSLMVLAAAVMIVATGATARDTGGLIGGIYGCCFGIRGAAAYNDGKEATALEWVDALLTGHIIAFIQGWNGTTTADLRKQYGDLYY
jgi:hypothetical protein